MSFASATCPTSAPSAPVSSGRWLAISPASVCATMQARGAVAMTARDLGLVDLLEMLGQIHPCLS